MATTYNKMLIDVNKPIVDKITTVEDDTARVLDVEFFSNGVAINLTGQTVRMYAVKPDGKDVFNNGVIRDAESGRVEFELTDQLLAVAGYIAVQFTIFEEERKILSTQIFKIFNTPKLRSDNAIESSNEYGSLVLLFQNIYDTIELMKKVDNTTTEIKDTCAKETTVSALERELQLVKQGVEELKILQNAAHWADLPNITFKEKRLKKPQDNQGNDIVEILNITGSSGHLISCVLFADAYNIQPNDFYVFKITIDDTPTFWIKVANKRNSGTISVQNVGISNITPITAGNIQMNRSNYSSDQWRDYSVESFTTKYLGAGYSYFNMNQTYPHGLNLSNTEQVFNIEDNMSTAFYATKFITGVGLKFKNSLKIEANYGAYKFSYSLDN